MTDLRIRQFQRYSYKDPAAFLRSLRKVEPFISASGLDYKIRSLHTRKLRVSHERRQAALFSHGVACRGSEFKFAFTCVEDADYDAVIRWYNPTECNFTPIQFEDAACALGSRYKDSPIGARTEMACFSFHPRKVICTGDGGMITTNNSRYTVRLDYSGGMG